MKGMVGKKNSSWTVFIIVSVLLISTVTMYFCFLYLLFEKYPGNCGKAGN